MSYFIDLSEQQVDNVKHVIFGNQKQANVQNESVVKIIARALTKEFGESCLNTEADVVESIRKLLLGCIDNGTASCDSNLIMLIAGEKSLANLEAMGPKTVIVNQPNPESPKFTFRIAMLGEDPDVDMEAEVGDVKAGASSAITYDVNASDLTLKERALCIKEQLLAVAPSATKAEVQDESLVALLTAEAFFKNGGEIKYTKKKSDPNHDKLVQDVSDMWKQDKSIGEIATALGISTDDVKTLAMESGNVIY